MSSLSSHVGCIDAEVTFANWSYSDNLRELADRSLVSFVKVISEIRRASDLSAYAKHPKLIPYFGLNFKLDLSYGLHAGWAVQGAIGSERKVDASYLGVHVNAVSQLQRKAKRYGVNIVMSEHIYQVIASQNLFG